MNRDESVGLSWATLLGFLRIATRHGIFPRPLSVDQALKIVEGWLTHPLVTIPRPGDRHWTILRQLLMQTGTAGNLTTDAHLAALAIEHDATLYSSDADFTRFEPELRTRNPLRP